MTVRAKFKVDAIDRSMGAAPVKLEDGSLKRDANDRVVYGPCEMHTIKMSPVYSNGDPNHENTKFWQASPSGSVQLGTVNADAARQFDIGKEYYIDFTPAP